MAVNSLTEAALAFATPFVIFAMLLALHVVVPAWKVAGYIKDDVTGDPVQYRLNGIAVFAIALLIWGLELTGFSLDWLWRAQYSSILGAILLSIVVTLYYVFREAPDGKGALSSFWLGRKLNVFLFGRVEVKMYLYIIGGGVLALNVLSGAAYHYNLHGANSNPGVFLYAAMWLFFVTDYFCFERVQLYTYDLIHEKVGFKLFFGCFVVYPYLYLIPLWGLAEYPAPDLSPVAANALLAASVVIFLTGWVISRGANLQKYTFKRWPDKKFLGIFEPETLSNGEHKILCSGLWRIARHTNYFGEVVMAFAMAIAFGYLLSPWAWVYLVFILTLFITRQMDDDQLCGAKYGEAWQKYKRRTPYRIFPGVY